MIILQEALRGMFYAPFYAALSLDAFGQEGVEVRFVSSPAPGRALDGLMDGTVDVGWGAPMRVNEGYQHIRGADFKCFGEVVTRDPFFLVTREHLPPFTPGALQGQRLGVVSEVPTPWLCMQHDIRLAGIDPAGLDRVTWCAPSCVRSGGSPAPMARPSRLRWRATSPMRRARV